MSQIDPSKITPQAPRVLRAGGKGAARAAGTRLRGTKPWGAALRAMDDDDEDDDDEDDPADSERDGAKAIADHEPLRAAAEEAHTKAAMAYGACKGTDSSAALLHADDMGDAAGEAHQAAKASSMTMRGAAMDPAAPPKPPSAPVPAPPGASAAAIARASVALAGGDAAAQAELLAAATSGRKLRAIFGASSFDELEGIARAALADATEAKGLRAGAEKAKKKSATRAIADAEIALRAEVTAAVTARKYARAELADVTEALGADGVTMVETWTPKAYLREMTTSARASMFAAKQARAEGSHVLPDETTAPISAAVADHCKARGYTAEQTARYAAQFALTVGASAPPQEVRQ